MKTKLFIVALCTLYQAQAAQQLSLKEAMALLESTCRFARGFDYVAPGTQKNPQLTRHTAGIALRFLHDNKENPQQPAGNNLEACKNCRFTTPDGQIPRTVWDVAKRLKEEKYGHDYMLPRYTLST
jgi:hypothetical protein